MSLPIMNLLESFCTKSQSPLLAFPLLRNSRAGNYFWANESAHYFFGDKKELFKLRPYAIDANEQSVTLDEEISGVFGRGRTSFRRTVVDKLGEEIDTITSLTRVEHEKKIYIFQQIDLLSDFRELFSDSQKKMLELEKELKGVKTLQGKVIACGGCRSVRTRNDRWVRFETYFQNNSRIFFSHGYCPACMEKYFPDCLHKKDKGK